MKNSKAFSGRRAMALFVVLAAAMAPAPTAGDTKANKEAETVPTSFYDLKATSLQGKPQDLGQYKGKVTLVVNVASQCGYTPQYKGLQTLREELKGRGFEVLGFPSNDFGAQEPGSAEEIQTFCQKNYGVSFPMFQKLVTKAGPEQSPIYSFLGQGGKLPEWNFGKYLVGKDGRVRGFYPSKVTPEDPKLRQAVEAALAE
jgi:glutathione peroxidase